MSPPGFDLPLLGILSRRSSKASCTPTQRCATPAWAWCGCGRMSACASSLIALLPWMMSLVLRESGTNVCCCLPNVIFPAPPAFFVCCLCVVAVVPLVWFGLVWFGLVWFGLVLAIPVVPMPPHVLCVPLSFVTLSCFLSYFSSPLLPVLHGRFARTCLSRLPSCTATLTVASRP